MFAKLLTAILAAICFIVPATVNAAGIAINRLPYEALGTHLSQPGQSIEALVLSLRPVLVEYSKQSGYEACGALAVNADKTQYGIVLGTNHSRIACAIYTDRLPEGMSYTGLSFHSHGTDRVFLYNKADRIFTQSEKVEGPIRGPGDDLYHFSVTDYRAGPGFLATPTGVLFQHGEGTTTSIVEAAAVAVNP